MGRSKFPGKPSKSINRKRISVLQLESNSPQNCNTSSSNTTAATTTAAAAATATANSTDTTTSAAANNSNTEEEDEQHHHHRRQRQIHNETQTQTATSTSTPTSSSSPTTDEENLSALSCSQDISFIHDQKRNGRRDDDDEDDENHQGGVGGGAASSSSNNSSSSCNTTNGQHQGDTSSNNNNSNGNKSDTQGQHDSSNSNSNSSSSSNTNTDSTKSASKNTKSDIETESEKEDEEEQQQPQDADDSNVNKYKQNKKACANNTIKQAATNLAVVATAHIKRKKFKNLNINKPEVMLPSSTKLKMQQQQCTLSVVAANSTTSLTTTPALLTTASAATKATALSTATTTTTTTTALSASSTVLSSSIDSITTNHNQNNLNVAAADLVDDIDVAKGNNEHNNNNNNNDNNNDDDDAVKKNNISSNNNSVIANHAADEKAAVVAVVAAVAASNDRCHDHIDDNNKSHNNNNSTSNEAKSGQNSPSNSLTHNGTTSEAASEKYSDITTLTTATTITKINEDEEPPTTLSNSGTNATLQNNSPSHKMDCTTNAILTQNGTEDATTQSATQSCSSTTSSAAGSAASADKKQKKTVTFKNVLETSDDKSVVKRFYNPDNRKPLLSIIKKECLNRPLMYTRNSDCIVRPSRLTEILKNNSNIDKLNALKFRCNKEEPAKASVLDGPLSRVFGAPIQDDEDIDGAQQQQQQQDKTKYSMINFRLTNPPSDEEHEEEEDEDDEDEEDDDEDEEEEEAEDEEKQQQNAAEEHAQQPELKAEQKNGKLEDDNDEILQQEQKIKLLEENKSKIVKQNGLNKTKTINDTSKLESAELAKDIIKQDDEQQQMIVDKHFVLPKRSSRSSRVIKPNKRLIEDGIICKKPAVAPAKPSPSATAKAIPKELTTTPTAAATNYFGLDKNDTAIGCSAAATSAVFPSTNIFANFGSIAGGVQSNSSSSSSSTAAALGKTSSFVLRQPRLQFDSSSVLSSSNAAATATAAAAANITSDLRTNPSAVAAALALTASLPKSLQQAISSGAANNATGGLSSGSLLSPTFSLNGTSSLINPLQSASKATNNLTAATALAASTPAVSTATTTSSLLSQPCVVCCSAINSKHLPQASKYGELSCEYCRKFISKIAKKSLAMKASAAASAPNNVAASKAMLQLQCKADGNCIIAPQANKAGHMKNFKKVYKERCGYCWLKKCLQTLQLPKVRLNAVLPLLPLNTNGCTAATKSAISPAIKYSLQDMKIRKELDLNAATTKLITADGQQIKWKALQEQTAASCALTAAAAAAATTTTNSLVDSMKLNSLKSNPLTVNVTFGSAPLLRPAILEKPLFPKSAIEMKQEKLDRMMEKKPLEVVTSFKTEALPLASETSPQSAARTKKSRDKLMLDKEARKELKIKEQISPKLEHKLTDMITPKQEELSPGNEASAQLAAVNAMLSLATEQQQTATAAAVEQQALATASSLSPSTAEKRQRIDLKGPRVKHVCRSASIVLGQPLAVFGEDGEETQLTAEELEAAQGQSTDGIKLTDENDNCTSCKTQETDQAEKSIIAGSTEQSISEPPLKTAKIETVTTRSSSGLSANVGNQQKTISAMTQQKPHHYNTHLSSYKKSTSLVASNALALPAQQRRKEPRLKCKLMISIDFWENYDPAEVCQTGFGLIITETVAQRALCFLCGSAGQEPMLFCSCCCEPYHQYCIQDEFNLKHSSLDDTLLLNESCLSVTGQQNSSQLSSAIAKLNWLCPRCTVCYTCNMSSGAKVRCQKCQKNYHSTCLGTSKRLLGADRPLICVNCLKCRSCSTTKVSKFVGNLPMCTNCFKLRKKGNYCPVCQKCYDDQDFDLKMMECGDCNQWVHAKCETLSDEQYNLLSTLPESIEFICKRCSRKSQEAKDRAQEWREAVREEFKSNLMSVLKLLSKSRQACALLRLSPRKQLKCSCAGSSAAMAQNKYAPKSLQFSLNEQSRNETASTIDVYEFSDREREVESPLPLQQQQQLKKCSCQPQQSSAAAHLSLVEIKQKICSGSYVTLAEFNYDMNLVIQQAYCDDLVIAYKEILSEQFPWFQNETQACTDALEEDMNESAGVYGLNSSLDSESDFNMDCMPHSHHQQQQQRDHLNGKEALERSALLTELPQDLEDIVCNLKSRLDSRICLFCRRTGEGMVGEEARLLYCGHDCWVHTNCALWSAEVFEEIDGSLQNVHSAVARGRMIKCSVCGNRGATVGCNVKSCGEHYHYPCARSRNCAFLSDKSMYCPSHATPQYIRVPQETQFEVTRPVYVELERKRKKLVEPSKVQFHIGSLEVKQLGQIMPKFSDTYESLVPVNFLCSRLYWSSKEPWKIVEYSVRTYIHNSSSTALSAGAIDLGKNFTVDHTQQDGMRIQMGLTQIQQWHQSLSKSAAAAAAHQHDSSYAQELDYFHYQQQSSSMTTTTTSSSSVALTTANVTQESAATATDEEPQTNADLLPPEIKDAIFEDCCDILEGISMLDIFTKCMNYEDMAQSEQSKDGVPCSDDDTMNSIGALTKQFSAELNSSWSSTAANNNNHCLEDNHAAAAQTVKLQRLKKSASPALSCDVNNKAAAIKRRKISENMLLTLNQQRTQKKEASSTNPANSKRSFTWSAEKRYNNHSNDDNNKLKLMQVDGADDSITEYRIVTQDPTTGTVKCERCQCSYRNLDSFHRHLPNCEPLSTSNSESDSENVQHQSQDLLQNINAQTLTLEQLQELQAKLQQQQQRQATASSMPSFIQTIPTQTFSQLQGLQQAATLPLQFQNVQNLQNLQNLQQLQQQLNQQAAQQQQQQQPLAGNFFISTAQPDITASTPDLQMYASGLQGLNLNGTFTLQPQTHYANQSLTQNQPQLIAVSTNPDGTQHIIQLPAAASSNTQHHSTVQLQTPTYQTLQATNSDKKIVLPVGGGKPLKTMATKAAQQAAAKNKLKATTAVKPIQSKLNAAAATATATIQPQSNTVNASQLLNQQILQQLAQQQAQQQAAASSQPQLLFQTANGHTQQPQLIMQQPQNIISFVTTGPDGSQQPQLQYVTLPATQTTTEFKPQLQTPTLFATSSNAQPMMQSAYLQADGSGNFVLTQGPPPQANNPTALQIISTPQGPQVIGTLIQPQTLQLQGGNIITTTTTATAENGLPQAAGAAGQPTQQQVLISGTPTANANGLEMLSATGTPQVILASAHTNSQPMYYGLETIVQNTVMSSQQFVSTAMPGVLSQNASFSATTTQVFQASKIEPLVDIPAGYVLLNNVDGSGTTLLQQQPNASTVNNQANQNNLIQAALQQQAAAAAAASMANEQQQQQQHAQNSTVFSIQTPPVSAQQQAANIGSFQLHTTQATGGNSAPQILLTQAQPQTGVHVTNSTQFVDANGMPQLISAKVAPQQVAAVKRTKPVTPVAVPTVSKVQPQVVNKVMPNVTQINQNNRAKAAQLQQQQQAAMPPPQHHVQKVMSAATTQPTAQQQQTQQIFLLNKPQQQQPAVLKQQQQQQPIVLSSPAAPAMINVKKTNLIKPLNKMEVKPKQMKTAAAATVVTKPTVNANSLSSSNSNPTAMQNMLPAATAAQIAAINNKMVLLKPQQQQPVQKQQQQQQPLQQNTAAATVALQQPIQDSNIDNISNHAAVQQPANPLQNDETKNSLIEFVNLQHVANQHQQHYNVADALLLDDSSQLAQQNLSHCSYSAAAAFETQSNNNQTAAAPTNDNLSNILPTIQRMPQYPNVNIVNPLQQYSSSSSSSASSATTSSSSSTTSTTTVTRPTNRVLPMQQKHSEQHTISSTCSSSSLSTYNTNTNTTTTAHISSSANNNGNSLITEASTIKANINKMAYEAEVKQMLMSSPNPQIEQQQQQQTQQLSLNQQQQQHELHQNQIINHIAKVVVNTSPNYDISEKTELSESDKLQHQHLTYVGSNGMADYEEPEECLASEPKFPPEGELLLGSDCCDTEEDCMNSIQAEEGDLDNDMDDDEDEDDGFSLKMPSANGSDNLSMDSDEPAVKEKISKILDNLTNEEGTDSLNANSTLEARMDYQQQQHHHQHQTAAEMQQQQQQHLLQQQHNQSSPQQIVSSEYYTPTEEESTAYLAAQLAENIKQVQQAASAGIADFQMTESNQEKLQIALPSTDYLGNCAVNHQQDPLLPDAASDSQQLQQQLSAPAIMSFRNPQPPPPAQQPPSRDPKKISGPHLLYEIQSEDGFTYKSSSISEVWEKVFEAVQVARRAHGLSPLPDGPLADMSGVQMIGLKTNALKYLIEQLPGVEKCAKYTPKYHKRNGGVAGDNSSSSSSYSSSGIIGAGSAALSIAAAGGAISHDIDDASGMDYASDQEELQENPYDSARCEPFAKRSEYDMFSWLASRHRKQPVQVFVQPSDNELVPRRGTGSNLPMAMKYRTLKETYKDYVGVFRSHIHGRGLYCTKDIEAGEMVIEYAGELIRSTLTDQRERYYNSRGIGCYMFKIDDNLVVDATMRGNAARFINHSCEPNCYSKVVDILGHKHIIIFALRRIVQGEELTYDYKFPFEDEKIPCSCSSKKCRKYLN